MRKVKVIIALILFIIVIFLFFKLIKKEHFIKYKIDKKYSVEEKFYIVNGEHNYDIYIKNGKNKYSFIISKNINKNKKIIKDIKSYNKGELSCILPIYKKNIKLDLYCVKDGIQVSNYYLYSEGDSNFKTIIKKLKKYNIKYNYTNSSSESYKNIKVYKKNIIDNYYFTVWNYKGIFVLNNKNFSYKKILNYDLYDNIMSTVTDSYFVLFENTSVSGIENVYYYDFNNGKVKKYVLDDDKKISKDSYINGVIGEDIYVTDRENKKEYIVNIRDKSIKQISTGNEFIVYENSVKNKITKSDFFMSDVYFDNVDIEDGKFNTESYRKIGDNYYYLDNNCIYRVFNDKNKILLFKLNNISDWKVIDNDILVVSNNYLYLYNDLYGLKKIVKNDEFKYNYLGINRLWKR